jgi:hypothetical protein
MNLELLIKSIPDWYTSSPGDMYDTLTKKNIPYVDNRDWTWKGIGDVWIPETGKRFGREGNKKLQDALIATGEHWAINQIAQGFPLVDDEIQQILYQLDAAGIVPGAKYVALEVKRDISLLEQYSMNPSPGEVAEALESAKLQLEKELTESSWYDRLQAAREQLTLWNGNPNTKPEL